MLLEEIWATHPGLSDRSIAEEAIAQAAEVISPKPVGSLPEAQAGPQEMFLRSEADIALYGGAAGSGKSFALLLDFAKSELISDPAYGAVIFRRTCPQITNEGALWDESEKLYPLIGANSKISTLEWRFSGGPAISFAHLEHEKTKFDWQGAQIPRIGFDELTHFTKSQFRYLLSRNRSATFGGKCQVRCTCNPDAESWVAEFVQWWLDSEGFPILDRSGVLRWFIWLNDELIWADTAEELRATYPDCEPKSFTFIAARIYDNPILLANDPSYLANLKAQHPVEQARLLGGNWKVKMEAGKVFDRTWFNVVQFAPSGGRTVRFWDIAATAQELASDSHYYTAGVKMNYLARYTVLDVIAEQRGPGRVEELITTTARQDGKKVAVRWELEGGSAGLLWSENLKKKLRSEGFDADYVKPVGDKVARATPLATDASEDRVDLIAAPWNDMFLSAAQAFDGSKKPLTNDVIDASSGAHAELRKGGVQAAPVPKPAQNSAASVRKIFG